MLWLYKICNLLLRGWVCISTISAVTVEEETKKRKYDYNCGVVVVCHGVVFQAVEWLMSDDIISENFMGHY